MSNISDNKIHLTVVSSDTAPDVYVTGAWANLDPNGNIVVYLYHDMPQMPSGFVINTNDHGRVTQEPSADNVPSLVRKVVARATIPLREAHVLGAWLADRANDGIKAVSEASAAQSQPQDPKHSEE